VIVTLTTIPDRIHFLEETLTSLQSQTRPPDEIVINVPLYSRRFRTEGSEQMRYSIPDWLAAIATEVDGGDGTLTGHQGAFGLDPAGAPDVGLSGLGNSGGLLNLRGAAVDRLHRLHRVKAQPSQAAAKPVYPAVTPGGATVVVNRIHTDHGPASKFIPTINRELRAGRWDSIVVIADDDVRYPDGWLAGLLDFVAAHPEHHGSALGLRGYCSVPANLWDWRIISQIVMRSDELEGPEQVDIITANNGFLVRPYFFLRQPIDIPADAPKSAYYMDDIWINGILAMNNVTKYLVPGVPAPEHREALQQHTQTLEQVPIGRAYHNNALLKHFEAYWTNCPQRRRAYAPEYFLRYQAASKARLNENAHPWAHLGVALDDVMLTKYAVGETAKATAGVGLAGSIQDMVNRGDYLLNRDKTGAVVRSDTAAAADTATAKTGSEPSYAAKPNYSGYAAQPLPSTAPGYSRADVPVVSAKASKAGASSAAAGGRVMDGATARQMFQAMKEAPRAREAPREEAGAGAGAMEDLLQALSVMRKQGKL
jgi:hypothetical protein